MSAAAGDDLDRFHDLVVADLAAGRPLADRPLAGPLLATRTRAEFVKLVRELAAERGLSVSGEELEQALRAARRSWQERWV
ncbi:MAG: hypothetical protein ACJ74O_09080 [Frankiaceae bacterium]